MNKEKIKNKNFFILFQMKKYFVYLFVMVLLILLVELFFQTGFLGFIPSISLAFWNFFKILGALILINNIKIFLSKKLKKPSWLLNFLMFLLKWPLLLYVMYLFWYIYLAIVLYLVTDNILLANVVLQSIVAMFLGIIFGVIVLLKNNKKNIKWLFCFLESHFLYGIKCLLFNFDLKKTNLYLNICLKRFFFILEK